MEDNQITTFYLKLKKYSFVKTDLVVLLVKKSDLVYVTQFWSGGQYKVENIYIGQTTISRLG